MQNSKGPIDFLKLLLCNNNDNKKIYIDKHSNQPEIQPESIIDSQSNVRKT